MSTRGEVGSGPGILASSTKSPSGVSQCSICTRGLGSRLPNRPQIVATCGLPSHQAGLYLRADTFGLNAYGASTLDWRHTCRQRLPTQVSIATYLPAFLTGGAGAVLLCLATAHGLLRTFMHARGVSPWSLRDTLGSIPLLLFGSASAGMSITVAVLAVSGMSPGRILTAFAAAFVVAGLLAIRLGLLALRKLT